MANRGGPYREPPSSLAASTFPELLARCRRRRDRLPLAFDRVRPVSVRRLAPQHVAALATLRRANA